MARTETDRAVKIIKDTRGMAVEIGRACGITKSAVYQWKKVPPHWVNAVAKITGLPPERIRPDIFKRRRVP